jgi:hypothetical protein
MILGFSPREVLPERSAVLESLGIPPTADVPERIEGIYARAADLLNSTVAPVGILATLSVREFGAVYTGEGRNESSSPVADIYPRAEHVALFAVTLGGETSRAIDQGFESGDFALASMLDALASEGADRLAELVERRFEEHLRALGWDTPGGTALRYSPGYCGWHVTGQRKLIAYLETEQIGVTLTDSCLMVPLKSVSGVILAGPSNIHRFRPTYLFCDACETRSCQGRLRALFSEGATEGRGRT